MSRVPEIVVVGSINADFIFNVPHLPLSNQTLMATHSQVAMGGKGLNQAIAAARAGAKVSMIGCVGDDSAGAQTLKTLKNNGVSVDHVCAIAGAPTGMASLVVGPDGQNMITVAAGANAHLSVGDVTEAEGLIAGADMVLAQLETPLAAIEAAFRIARAHGVKTVLNPAPADQAALSLFPLADVVTPNETELAGLSGITETDDRAMMAAFQALKAAGATHVVTTLGARGSLVLMDGTLVHRAPYKVEAIDATGAGDVFNGVLAFGLAQGRELYEAMGLATAASALSVLKPSADSAPTREEIRAFSGL
ncbi:MAG: ribokinase [Asticcacaulis sp.]